MNLDRRTLYALYHLLSQAHPYWFWKNYKGLLAFADESFAKSKTDLEDYTLAEWQQGITFLFAELASKVKAFSAQIFTPKDLARQLYEHLQICQEKKAHYILKEDADFPSLLSFIDMPPFALTVFGTKSLLLEKMVSVVGSRRASLYSLKQAKALGQLLAEKGFVVVSGGALGCDIMSHKGVLSSKLEQARALVVFAGGLGYQVPYSNQSYFRQILSRGGVFVSERLWSTRPRPMDFPIRNRIIMGLSQELIIMQAAAQSGTMRTAQLALDAGRDLFLLKQEGSFLSTAGGSLQLVEDGACFFTKAEELLDMLEKKGA